MTYQDNDNTIETTIETTLAPDTLLPDTFFLNPDNRIRERGPQPAKGLDIMGDMMSVGSGRRMPLVLVLEDGHAMSEATREMCDFLDIAVERIDSESDLQPFLRRCQPMAVVAAMDAAGQDGGNVLKTVAQYDPTLPVLLVMDDDPTLAGAADAVADVWGLTEVVQSTDWPSPGDLAEFLCRAGVRGRCLALMPV